MDETKTSLSAINGEIRRLATAAAAGDFSLRGDEDRFAMISATWWPGSIA